MPFRFDMQGKTPQQQAIVAKRDAENKRRESEETNRKEKIANNSAISDLKLVIDKDTCPLKDNIIIKHQCSGCKYYMMFIMHNGQPCVKCSYQLETSGS